MISLIEMLSNAGYLLLVYLTTKTSYITLIQIMTLYMIILPYAFLMNTSHNKNRIIEHGWVNIFKNIIGKPNNCISVNNSDSSEDNVALNETKSDDGKKSKNDSMNIFVTESSSNQLNVKNNVKTLIKNESNNNIRPSTSGERRNKVKMPSKQLIDKLLNAIDDEKEYHRIFQSFVIYIEHCKQGNDPRKFQLEDSIFPYDQKSYIHSERNEIVIKVKSSANKKGDHKRKGKSVVTNIDSISVPLNEAKRVLKGNKEERSSSRRDTLLQLRSFEDNLESFIYLGEKFIDLEESFIM